MGSACACVRACVRACVCVFFYYRVRFRTTGDSTPGHSQQDISTCIILKGEPLSEQIRHYIPMNVEYRPEGKKMKWADMAKEAEELEFDFWTSLVHRST